MQVSEKLAREIFYIEFWHILSLFLFIGINLYIFLKAKKTALLFSYLLTEACIMLWIVSKIFKTVSPDITIRWFFIVLQYFGISFLGGSVLLFALIYTHKKVPSIKHIIIIYIPCLFSFLIVATNPLHMLFYSKYTFYSDNFGSLFYLFMAISYSYIISSAILLAKNFIGMFGSERRRGILFSIGILLPFVINIFYVLDLFDILFDYQPLFDYTPIAINISLILFAVAAFKYRFLDILNIASKNIFENSGNPAIILSNGRLISKNCGFQKMEEKGFVFDALCKSGEEITFLNRSYQVFKYQKNGYDFIRFTDITDINILVQKQHKINEELSSANIKLNQLILKKKELASLKIKDYLLQELHDIMGHSAVICLSRCEQQSAGANSSYSLLLSEIKEMLSASSKELLQVIRTENISCEPSYVSEIKKIIGLTGMKTSFTVQGKPLELTEKTLKAVYSLIREAVTNAVKHSFADTFDAVLRFDADFLSLFILDNGKGCDSMILGTGLSGMQKRLLPLKGQIKFISSAEEGFRIYAAIPAEAAYAV